MPYHLNPEETQVLQMHCMGYDGSAISTALNKDADYASAILHRIKKAYSATGLEALVSIAQKEYLDITPQFGKWINLSPRQEEVIKLAASGMKNAQIADKLGITETAVNGHFSNIYDKLTIWAEEDVDCNPRNTAIALYLAHERELSYQGSAA